MTIGNAILTKEQQACVNYSGRDCVVRGVAGSGKSYVLLRRAVKLNAESKGKESIYIFMYNGSLVRYTDEILKDGLEGTTIKISTVDKYCVNLYNNIRGKINRFKAVKDEERIRIIESTLRSVRMKEQPSLKNHRFYSLSTTFWKEEFEWIKGMNIQSEAEYVSSNRRGRGGQIKMNERDKGLAWTFFSEYKNRMERSRKNDWEDIYIYLLRNFEKIPKSYYIDHILIDEAQDLTLAKVKLMRMLSMKSFTIAADVAQKIYKTTFSWKEVGVEVLGSGSRKLSKSFRSTEQIILLAEDLLSRNRVRGDREEYTKAVIPEVQGPKPLLVDCNGKDDEIVLTMVKTFLKAYPEDTIAIVYRTNSETTKAKRWLEMHGIDSQVITKKDDEKVSILGPGVKLVTAHSSKGLEFACVIICRLNEGNYPSSLEMADADDKEEMLCIERSLLYVAMTRAKHILMMSYDRVKRSSFVDEFDDCHYKTIRYPEDNIVIKGVVNVGLDFERIVTSIDDKTRNSSVQKKSSIQKGKEQENTYSKKKESIRIGARVYDKRNGEGRIIKMNGERITVQYKRAVKSYNFENALKAGTIKCL